MCEFCENRTMVREELISYGSNFQKRSAMLKNRREMAILFTARNPLDIKMNKEFRIAYCPICGRKLSV